MLCHDDLVNDEDKWERLAELHAARRAAERAEDDFRDEILLGRDHGDITRVAKILEVDRRTIERRYKQLRKGRQDAQ